MSLLPSLLRRRGPSSENMHRHSLYFDESANNPDKSIDSRASEQITRKSPVADWLSPSMAGGSNSRTSVEGAMLGRSISPPVQEESSKHRRFSMLKFRHASDSQLSRRARDQAPAPPVPSPPEIITTAPTMDLNATSSPTKRMSRILMPGRTKALSAEDAVEFVRNEKRERRKTLSESGPSTSKTRVTFDEPYRPSASGAFPPAYGDDANSTLAIPVNRLSESSRSDGSSGDHGVYSSTTTTTHTVHTTTTFFRLPRRKKPAPLFDLSHLPQKSNSQDQGGLGPRISTSSSIRHPGDSSNTSGNLHSTSVDNLSTGQQSPAIAQSPGALGKLSSTLAGPAVPLIRHGSTASSNKSSPSRSRIGLRGRSSTLSSLRNAPTDDPIPTPTLPSTRTSISTGRKSFGDLFNISHRLRQNSEPPFPRGSGPTTPGSSTSKNNSIQLVREPTIVLPERNEDDTPAKYLVRLEEAVSRGVVASVLSKGTDPFSQAVLRSYMRGFGFFGDPMDMAIRKLLMEVELPKETQQIDRCLQGFANRYHECNPGIYASPDQAYFIAFSLLILHTDVFNKNNKHKMQKSDYLKNTKGEGVFDEVLECFYDNISYTPFIHVEDDLDINGERILPHKVKKKSILSRGTPEQMKRPSKEPVDPYTLIIDSRLDSLRPNLKEVMHLEEHYSYLGTATSLNLQDLQKTFFRTGVLQIVSARSRPDAFMSEKTVTNTEDAHPGIVDIKITKVGLLWRKDAKKKKTRSPWQEWGAILTGAQLYFFRNTNWIKGLMSQLESHNKQGHDGIPVIFKPPLDHFKPDALMSTDDAVALLDSTYKKHKNAFVFVRHGGFEETFLADNEQEMNDWLAKLNYAAAFRTSGVRMRGVVGGNYDGQRTRGIRRLEGQNDSSKSVQTPTGEVTIVSGKIDRKMADDILAARREIMLQKIADAEEKLITAQKQLDAQLRNARHLQILAPIQSKTRDQVILAAGRISAQLKWGRMEIWRLRCHKDILSMDLEEEKSTERVASPLESTSSDRSTLGRLHSKASTIKDHISSRSPASIATNHRPSTATPHAQQGIDAGVEDVFHTPPSLGSASTFHKAQATWDLPPLNMDKSSHRHASISAERSSSPSLDHQTPSSSLMPNATEADRAPSPNIDADEQAVLAQEGLIADTEKSPKEKGPAGTEAGEIVDQIQIKEKDKLDRGKIRRSLHRTLRDAHVPSHNRSRKGKDSSSGAAMSEEGKEDVLSRGTGSFVVHGKKASVITFGSELQGMSPDERLRLRRQAQKDGGDGLPQTVIEDFQSVLAEPVEWHEKHGSAATGSTTTARSFRELHNRLAVSGGAGLSEEEDSDAVTFSDGRRTPLPPVEDEDEDAPGSYGKQAMFYTPDASPTTAGFRDRSTPSTPKNDDETRVVPELENYPPSSTPLQTVVSA